VIGGLGPEAMYAWLTFELQSDAATKTNKALQHPLMDSCGAR
jgi:hypothetical protein